jgi:hypothetical protein
LPISHPEFGNCWVVQGYEARGYVRIGDKQAHVIAYEQASGELVPDGEIILHTCDVRNCVRNDEPGTYVVGGNILPRFGHVARGTPKDNMVDASEKGHSAAGAFRRASNKPESYRRGEKHHRAVLTLEQAQEIRRRYATGDVLGRELAAEYEVSHGTIKNLLAGKTYAHKTLT